MDCDWYSLIREDLESVEDVMMDIIKSDNPELTEMCEYVLKVQGKRIRPSICLLTYRACGGTEPKKAINTGAAVELIHNATLIHDDINDEGELRRGRKALYREYTLGKSIVAGDYLYALGFKLISNYGGDLVGFVISAAAAMGSGEFNQKDFEHKGKVSEADYMKIIDGKTAKLIECSAKCGAYLADADLETLETMGTFAHRIGMAFQIIDDTLDVVGDESVTGKPIGSDIVEGKPTLPTIFAMQDPVHGEEIRRIFEKGKPTHEETVRAINLIKKTDAIGRCRAAARKIGDEAIEALADIEDSEYKAALIDLADFIVDRNR